MTDVALGGATASARHSPGFERRYPDHQDAERLYGPDFHRDPHAVYRRLRSRHGTVAPVFLDDDVPAWIVLGYREVHYVATHADSFSKDPRTWNAWDLVPPTWPLRPPLTWRDTILWGDGERHAARAAAVDEALAAIDPFELATRCERMADGLIDDFAADGTADLISQYAARLPMVVGTALLGLPQDEIAAFVADLAAVLFQVGDIQAADDRLSAGVREKTADRRRAPGSDPLSRLAAHPAAMTDDEIFNDLLTLFIMAQTKVSAWIGNAMRLMLTDRQMAAGLVGGRRSVNQALQEVLWEEPPHSNALGRFATRQIELGGRRIQQGDLLVLSITATNCDPLVRPDPASRVPGSQAHLSFGAGVHRCPYAAQDVSEIVVRTAIEVLLDRLPDVSLAVPDSELVWAPVVFLRALATLPVTFTQQ